MGINREALDPVLRDLLGCDDVVAAGPEARDPVGDLFFHAEYGVDRPGAAPTPKTPTEISRSLENLRRQLGVSQPTPERQEFFRKMANSANTYEASPFVRKFLRGAAENDHDKMRQAVKQLVADNRDAILDAHARVTDSGVQRGEPNSIRKVGGWSYKYDAAGKLEAAFEGDAAPTWLQ
jgi:hypothetical protein